MKKKVVNCAYCDHEIEIDRIILPEISKIIDPENKMMMCSSCLEEEYGKDYADWVRENFVDKEEEK